MTMKNEITNPFDESGKRKYFTIIPNYIIDHSTSPHEHCLYAVIKRIAGENSTCWASPQTIAKRMGVSPNTVRKYRDKLEQRGWIEKIGSRQVGRTKQYTHEYKIVDLWKVNENFYAKKIKPSPDESFQQVSESIHLMRKKGSPVGSKEESFNKETERRAIFPKEEFWISEEKRKEQLDKLAKLRSELEIKKIIKR